MGTIQRIITIPAALQGIPNPVPRIQHPEWLHKKILEKNDTVKQRKLSEFFGAAVKKPAPPPRDIEDCLSKRSPLAPKNVPVITTKRNREPEVEEDLTKSWRQVLGNPPSRKTNVKEWILFQKKKWAWQRKQKMGSQRNKKQKLDQDSDSGFGGGVVVRTGAGRSGAGSIGGFLRKTQRTLLDTPWQILQ